MHVVGGRRDANLAGGHADHSTRMCWVPTCGAGRAGFLALLGLNSFLAFFVNLSNFLVTKHTSALTLQARCIDPGYGTAMLGRTAATRRDHCQRCSAAYLSLVCADTPGTSPVVTILLCQHSGAAGVALSKRPLTSIAKPFCGDHCEHQRVLMSQLLPVQGFKS